MKVLERRLADGDVVWAVTVFLRSCEVSLHYNSLKSSRTSCRGLKRRRRLEEKKRWEC